MRKYITEANYQKYLTAIDNNWKGLEYLDTEVVVPMYGLKDKFDLY